MTVNNGHRLIHLLSSTRISVSIYLYSLCRCDDGSRQQTIIYATVVGNAIVPDDASKNLGQASKEQHYPLPYTIAGANAAAPPPCNSAVVVATANNHNHIKKEEEEEGRKI